MIPNKGVENLRQHICDTQHTSVSKCQSLTLYILATILNEL